MIRIALLAQIVHDNHLSLRNIPPVFLFQIIKDETKLARKRVWYRLKIFLKFYFKRTAKEPVFVVAKRRSGSNLFLSYLNSVPEVTFWPPEPLNWHMHYGIRKNWVSKKSVFRHLAYTLNSARTKICGFKVLFFRLKHHGLALDDFKSHFPNAKFIILYRKSLLDQFVSLKVAEQTKQWEWTRDFRLPESIRVDVGEFRDFCRETKEFYEKVRRSPWIRDCALVLQYEELTSDPQKVFESKVFPFLGLPPRPVSTSMIKQNTKSMEAIIENFHEVRPWITEFKFDLSLRGISRSAVGEESIHPAQESL